MSSENKRILHRKSTTSEGQSALGVLLLTILGMGIFQWFLFPTEWSTNKFIVVAFIVIEMLVAAGVICFVAVNVMARAVFECRIDETTFSCLSPVKGCGDSFSLMLSDIAKLEKEDWGDGRSRWYVWDTSGHRFWLTSNYNNPVEDFIAAIRASNPKIATINT